MSPAKWLRRNRFIDEGLCRNTWIWVHMPAGGIGARVGVIWLEPWQAVLLVLWLAIYWEAWQRDRTWQALEPWSWRDALGDIIGAVAVASLVVW